MDKEDVVYTHTHTHTMDYYLAIKKSEILPFATTWIELEGIMLSKIRERQISYESYDMSHSYDDFKIQNR